MTIWPYVATGVIAFIVGYTLDRLKPKGKLIYWSPHNFIFDLQNENIVLQTNSITVQNVGSKSAQNVEVIYRSKPDFFEFFPQVSYETTTAENGEFTLHVKNLGPKEHFMLQLLNYRAVPYLENVRFEGGQARLIQIQPQRVFPKWIQRLIGVLLLIGLIFTLSVLIKMAIFIVNNLNLL